MKQLIATLVFLAISYLALAQAPPQGINYQAVAIDEGSTELVGVDLVGQPLLNKVIRVRFTIIKNSVNGPTTYREYHSTTTDDYGLFSVVIGQGNLDDSPMEFSEIQWGTGDHFLRVEIDITGGTIYKHMSTAQFWSVPYALYAKYTDHSLVPMYADMTFLPTGNLAPGMIAFVRNCIRDGIPCMVIWDGAQWLNVDGDSDPTNELGLHAVANEAERDILYPTPQIGDMVWNGATGNIQVWNGAAWVSFNATTGTYTASNGLTLTGQNFELGGTLNHPTTINTSETNTLAITGLQAGNLDTDQLVTVNPTTGVLTRTPVSQLLQEFQVVYIATAGQNQFTTPIPITDINKVNVYRNGIRVGHTFINSNTIQLETGIICVNNDQVRIVQFR